MNLPVTVQVDGGITEETILRAAEAGATCFVAGSSVYGVDEALGGPEAAIASLREAPHRSSVPAPDAVAAASGARR